MVCVEVFPGVADQRKSAQSSHCRVYCCRCEDNITIRSERTDASSVVRMRHSPRPHEYLSEHAVAITLGSPKIRCQDGHSLDSSSREQVTRVTTLARSGVLTLACGGHDGGCGPAGRHLSGSVSTHISATRSYAAQAPASNPFTVNPASRSIRSCSFLGLLNTLLPMLLLRFPAERRRRRDASRGDAQPACACSRWYASLIKPQIIISSSSPASFVVFLAEKKKCLVVVVVAAALMRGRARPCPGPGDFRSRSRCRSHDRPRRHRASMYVCMCWRRQRRRADCNVASCNSRFAAAAQKKTAVFARLLCNTQRRRILAVPNGTVVLQH